MRATAVAGEPEERARRRGPRITARSAAGRASERLHAASSRSAAAADADAAIDFVHAAGRVKVVSSEAAVLGKPQLVPHHADNEWASDHAAVVTVVRLGGGGDD